MDKFADLKPGDPVVVQYGMRGAQLLLTEVLKVTPKGRIKVRWFNDTERQFSPQGGEIGGDRYWSASLKVPTPELIAKIARAELLQKIGAIQLHTLSSKQLQQILDVVEGK